MINEQTSKHQKTFIFILFFFGLCFIYLFYVFCLHFVHFMIHNIFFCLTSTTLRMKHNEYHESKRTTITVQCML